MPTVQERILLFWKLKDPYPCSCNDKLKKKQTGERPFKCVYEGCGKCFVTKGHLKSHFLTHTGEKPNVCKTCGKMYSRLGRLRIHERTHVCYSAIHQQTGERPYVCPYQECLKTFTEKGNLNTHIRIHTGERPFECKVEGCGMKFTTLGHLNDHSRSHKNDRYILLTLLIDLLYVMYVRLVSLDQAL